MESEFGAGFVYTMILFAKHWGKIFHDVEVYKTSLQDEQMAYDMWFNGAADHVYEMTIPDAIAGSEFGMLAEEFIKFVRSKRLPMSQEERATKEDFNKAFVMLESLAMKLDEHLGMKPVKAQWN